MKKFISLLLSTVLVSAVFIGSATQVSADIDEYFSFDMVGSLQINSKRYRGLVQIPQITIKALKDIPERTMLRIRIPEGMPAIFSANLKRVSMDGSGYYASRVPKVSDKQLSDDQKSILLQTDTSPLMEGEDIIINGLFIKIYNANNTRYPLELEYEMIGDPESKLLKTSSGLYLDRSEGRRRRLAPEVVRGFKMTQTSPESAIFSWKPVADPKVTEYKLSILDTIASQELFDTTLPADQTRLETDKLVDGRKYMVYLRASNGLESEFRYNFVAGEKITPLSVLQAQASPDSATTSSSVPSPTDTPSSTPAVPSTTAAALDTATNTAPPPTIPLPTPSPSASDQAESSLEKPLQAPKSAKDRPYKLPHTISYTEQGTEQMRKILWKVQPQLPSTGKFNGSDPVRTEKLRQLMNARGFKGLLSDKTVKRLQLMIKKLQRKHEQTLSFELTNAEVVQVFTLVARYERIRYRRLVKRPKISQQASSSEKKHRRFIFESQRKATMTPRLAEKLLYGQGKVRAEDFFSMMYYLQKRLEAVKRQRG